MRKTKKLISVLVAFLLIMPSSLLTANAAGATNTLTLEEDWHVTSSYDMNVGDGKVLYVNGSNYKYTIYEMGADAHLTNSTGTVWLTGVRIINTDSSAVLGNLAAISKAASKIVSVTAPDVNATKLNLPKAAGYTVSIKSSSNNSVIATDGTITPPDSDTTVNLVFTLTGTNCKADTASIPIIVPAKSTIVSTLDDFRTAFKAVKALGGSITLGGDIYLDGKALDGITNDALSLTASGTVTIHTGIYRIIADSTSDVLNIGSNVTIDGRGYYHYEDGSSSFTKFGVVAAIDGGAINLGGGTIKATANNGAAVFTEASVTSAQSNFNMLSGSIVSGIDSSSNACFGVMCKKYSNITMSGGTITVNGDGNYTIGLDKDYNLTDIDGGIGIDISSYNNSASANLTGGTITVSGKNSVGIFSHGGNATVCVDGATINTDGSGSIGAYAFGCSAIIIGNTTASSINANGESGTGLRATHGSTMTVKSNASVSATGNNGIGVDIGYGGTGDLEGGTISAKYCGVNVVGSGFYADADIGGGTITVSGEGGIGINAQSTGFNDNNGNKIQDSGEDSCVVDFSGGTVTAQGSLSRGMVAFGMGQAQMSGSAAIALTGANTSGLYASSGGNITMSAGTITETGSGSMSAAVFAGGNVSIAALPNSNHIYLGGGTIGTVQISGHQLSAPDSKSVYTTDAASINDLSLPSSTSGCAVTWAANSVGNTSGGSVLVNTDSSCTLAAANNFDGNTVGDYIVTGAVTNSYANITVGVTVTVANRSQAAPTGLAGVAPTSATSKDGQITGTTTAMQYKLSADSTWKSVTGTSITGLSAGTYEVRFTAKTGYNAGTAASVTVPAYTAPVIGGGGGAVVLTTPVTTTATSGTTTTTTATVTGNTGGSSGKITASVPKETVTSLVEDAKKAESAGRSSVVEVKVDSTAQGQAAKIEIPRDSFNEIASETKADVKVNTSIGTVVFDAKAVESISGAAVAGDVSINIAKVESSALTDTVRQTVGDRPVYDFSVNVGGSTVSTFGGGNVEVSIPYTPKTGEDHNAIVVYYIDNSGNLQSMRGRYDSDSGMVNFITTHFSKYTIGYNKVVFSDVTEKDWFNDAVGFIAARGITTGTSANAFSPLASLTRGQFIVMLMRAYGISPDTVASDNFSDAGNTYYTNYLSVAKRLGISTGVGNNRYAPDEQLSRQDMFVLLYRTLSLLGETPEIVSDKTLADFTDDGAVKSYALEAMKALVAGGIVTGSDGKLNPDGITTRAQMAQVLYKLLSE